MRKSVVLYGIILFSLAFFACITESENMKKEQAISENDSEVNTIQFYHSTVSGIFNFIK
jgi:hypothetical protein